LATRRTSPRPGDFTSGFNRIESSVEQMIRGKAEQVRSALVCLMAGGHLLIEDVPGVGKTLLAKAIARSIGCTWRRIQFTPDLLPTDVTGVRVFNQERRDFEFKPGAVFANIVLADEVNRASPKTQAALLEAMEERQVTIDGETHTLQEPFLVIATQNPIEHEGTYPLPAAQLDRFLMRVTLGYPDPDAELEILATHGEGVALEEVEPVVDARTVVAMIAAAHRVHVADPLRAYIIDVVTATRKTPDLSLGASPRASLALLRATRALAAADGRDYATPDDVKGLVAPVLGHRLIAAPEAEMSGRTVDDVLADIMMRVPVPLRS
jgi:MoxR-like ATPase